MNSRKEEKMTYQKMKWTHRENCRFDIDIRVIFWRNLHLKTSLPSLQNSYLKENSVALKASCIVFSAAHILQRHSIVLTLYCEWNLHLHSLLQSVNLSCWIFDCPPSFEEKILYFEISIVGNSLESFVIVWK